MILLLALDHVAVQVLPCFQGDRALRLVYDRLSSSTRRERPPTDYLQVRSWTEPVVADTPGANHSSSVRATTPGELRSPMV
jgi:hypothetical protein